MQRDPQFLRPYTVSFATRAGAGVLFGGLPWASKWTARGLAGRAGRRPGGSPGRPLFARFRRAGGLTRQ